MIYLTGRLVWNKTVMLLKLLLRKTESSNVFFLQTFNSISCLSGSEVTLHVLITGLKITHINSQVIFLYTKYIILSAQVSVCRGQISYLLTLKISSWGCKILFCSHKICFMHKLLSCTQDADTDWLAVSCSPEISCMLTLYLCKIESLLSCLHMHGLSCL